MPPSSVPATAVLASEEDASRKEVIYYSLGSLEGGLSGFFLSSLNTVMIVALGMSPILLGLILTIKTFYTGLIDPLVAQLSDNTRSRWGRRRPYIFIGGFGRLALLICIFLMFPRDGSIKPNVDLATAKAAHQKTAIVAPANPQLTSAPAQSTAPVVKKEKPGMIENIRMGFAEFTADHNPYHRKVAIYLLISCLLFATFGSFCDTAYYALGIELSPSYDGRTSVVTYRSLVLKTTALITPWVLPFCFLPLFKNVIDGLAFYAIGSGIIGSFALLLMLKNSRERQAVARTKSGPGFFKAIWLTIRNIHFLKILFLYSFIGFTNGIFTQLGMFLTIYWVFQGDALAGTTLSGYSATLATVLALGSLPLINWACRRLQKHRTLRIAVLWMSVGAALKWVLVTPEHPYWQLVLPFFFSIGISSVFMVLPTMMADVTDIDELQTGARREGMFGAVMSFMNRLLSSLQPLISGTVLVLAGFDVSQGAQQAPETIFRMRLMFSLIPAGLLLLALLALWRYPLTREYMAEVKATLLARRAAAGNAASSK